MTLKEYLKDNSGLPRICILTFDGDSIDSHEYDNDRFCNIKDEFLNSEVMDTKKEEDCMEVWVMMEW